MRTIAIEEGYVSIDGNLIEQSYDTFYLNTDKITAFHVYNGVDERGEYVKQSKIKILTEHHMIDIDGRAGYGAFIAKRLLSSESEERDETDESLKVCVTNLDGLTDALEGLRH